MNDFILSLIKYTAMFMCSFYAFVKLLRIKLKAWDLFDIPLFIALSAVLYFVTVYIKILVPIGLLIFGIVFLLLRFRKTFYESVTIGTISLGFSIVMYFVSFIISIPITATFNFIKNENLKIFLTQLTNSLIQVVVTFFIFKIKRFKSGINPKGETATFEIMLHISVGSIIAMMLVYIENITQSMLEIILIISAMFVLLIFLWWRRHITYSYREAVKRQNAEFMENTIEEYKLKIAETDLRVAASDKLVHFLNKALPNCFLIAERVAAETGSKDAIALCDMLQNVMDETHLTNEKCSLQNIPQTGLWAVDAPIIELFAEAEHKNFSASAEINADVEAWFAEGLNKKDIQTLLNYLCDNAVISALGAPLAKVRLELSSTANKKPLILVYDSGEQFDENVLEKLGVEQVTTRSGGSGIGLLTVFEILAKYGASFTLDEEPQRVGFTKRIEIAFDGRRAVVVRTLRESAVAALSNRKGVVVERVGFDGEILHDGTDG